MSTSFSGSRAAESQGRSLEIFSHPTPHDSFQAQVVPALASLAWGLTVLSSRSGALRSCSQRHGHGAAGAWFGGQSPCSCTVGKKFQSTAVVKAIGSATTWTAIGLSVATIACNSLVTATTTEPVVPAACLPPFCHLKPEIVDSSSSSRSSNRGAGMDMLSLRWELNCSSLQSSSLRHPSISRARSPLEQQPRDREVTWAPSTCGPLYFVPVPSPPWHPCHDITRGYFRVSEQIIRLLPRCYSELLIEMAPKDHWIFQMLLFPTVVKYQIIENFLKHPLLFQANGGKHYFHMGSFFFPKY